jgi:transaldolase
VNLTALAAQLQDEGAQSFIKSWNELLARLAQKVSA